MPQLTKDSSQCIRTSSCLTIMSRDENRNDEESNTWTLSARAPAPPAQKDKHQRGLEARRCSQLRCKPSIPTNNPLAPQPPLCQSSLRERQWVTSLRVCLWLLELQCGFFFPLDGVIGTTFDDHLQMSLEQDDNSAAPNDASLVSRTRRLLRCGLRWRMGQMMVSTEAAKAHIWFGTGDVDLDRGIEQ